jgi:cobalt-precorrin 5A hydrolase
LRLVGEHHPIDALATLQERAALPALQTLSRDTGLPLIALPREALSGIATPTRSPRILARFATGSVAEALALVAIGAQAQIAASRQISTDGSASAAIAIRIPS